MTDAVLSCFVFLLFQAITESYKDKSTFDVHVHHDVYYVNGTTCDLTGKQRRATVKVSTVFSLILRPRVYNRKEGEYPTTI